MRYLRVVVLGTSENVAGEPSALTKIYLHRRPSTLDHVGGLDFRRTASEEATLG